jgi:hypothetical protein
MYRTPLYTQHIMCFFVFFRILSPTFYVEFFSYSLTLDGPDGVPDRSRVFHVYGLPDFTRQIQEEKLIKHFSQYGSMNHKKTGVKVNIIIFD